MPDKHALIGGSSFARTRLCPGSVRLVQKLPRTTSAAAERGTALHEAIAQVIEKKDTPGAMFGLTMGNGYRITQADVAALYIAHHQFRKLTANADGFMLERWVQFNRDAGGTADVLAWRGATGLCADFKFGAVAVDAYQNQQLTFYAAAAVACRALPRALKHVNLAIIQPDARPPLSRGKVSVGALRAFRITVENVTQLIVNDTAPLNPGPHCANTYCPARDTCPALKGKPQSLAHGLARLASR
jgi:hypothetical protein